MIFESPFQPKVFYDIPILTNKQKESILLGKKRKRVKNRSDYFQILFPFQQKILYDSVSIDNWRIQLTNIA